MRALAIFLLSLGAIVLSLDARQNAKSSTSTQACREFSFDGRVNGGEAYSRRLGGDLWLQLSPLKDGWGWIIEMRPAGSNDDYAFPLNPPYHGDNIQWLGTGYSNTVEYRMKYEHDVFFTATQDEHERDVRLYEQYLDNPGNTDLTLQGKFFDMLPSLRSSLLRLKPLQYETSDEGKSVSWMQFSVTVIAPDKFEPGPELKTTRTACPSGAL